MGHPSASANVRCVRMSIHVVNVLREGGVDGILKTRVACARRSDLALRLTWYAWASGLDQVARFAL